MTSPKRLMLIDGHSMAFRAFYALPAEKFSTSSGQCTNAVYGFVSMLSNLISKEKPTHIAAAFDVGRTTFRSEMFPEYKAQRESAPEEFKGQVGLIKELLETLGIATLEKENYEADDIIATLATEATAEGDFETLIVTGDRDSFQLVNDATTVLYPMKGVSVLHRFTPEAVEEKYGLTPQQYPDFAALRGDPSDNMPGIPGVGEKTAQKWIVGYGSLAQLLEQADSVKGKVGEKLRERVEQVRLNRELTEMVKDLDLPYKPEDLEFRQADIVAIADAFDSLEFGNQLRQRVLATLPNLGSDNDQSQQMQPSTGTGNASAGSDVDLSSVEVAEQPLAEFLETPGGRAVVCAGSAKPGDGDCTALAIVDADYRGVIIRTSEMSENDERALAQWLASEQPKFFHGAKAAWHMLRGRGFDLDGIAHDTLLAAYLLLPGQRTYDLHDVYQRHTKKTLDIEQPSGQMSLLDDAADDSAALKYLLHEAAAVMELSAVLTQQLQEIESFELYVDLELPLVPILAQMEAVGIAVDIDKLQELKDHFQLKVNEAQDAARELAGDPNLNLSSPKQLQVVLFDTLEMPKTKKTKTGYSTAAKEIEALAKNHPHPFLDQLLAHRENQKMKTTLEGLIKCVATDGRIHTTYKQTVTSTGRLSSTDPNLQNIPVRTPAGREIRSAFVVGDGYETLLTADYSQIEMRVMAHLSEDAGLVEAYRQGEDLHNYVGSRVFEVPVEEVTPELRRRVKAMSYGLVYGLSAYGLSGQLDITPGEAKSIMNNYFKRFGGVKAYLDGAVAQARQSGYTETMFGRRRYLPELDSDNRVVRENAERAALNAPIQGTAADIIKVAMLRVDAALRDAGVRSRVLLQVHDELVVEVAKGELDKVRTIVENEMDNAIELSVPLEVSSGHGSNWDEAAH